MANERTAPQAGGRPMNRKHRKFALSALIRSKK